MRLFPRYNGMKQCATAILGRTPHGLLQLIDSLSVLRGRVKIPPKVRHTQARAEYVEDNARLVDRH